jgi:hypothetical protein
VEFGFGGVVVAEPEEGEVFVGFLGLGGVGGELGDALFVEFGEVGGLEKLE